MSARNWWAVETSAERSEAREDDVGRSTTSRVASPLVMATHERQSRDNKLRWARRGDSHVKPLPPASQGGSATRYDHRRRRRLLRLRCAPPSSVSHLGIASAQQVASARCSFVRRCGGSLWCDPRESEQVASAAKSRLSTRASKLRSRLRALLKRNETRAALEARPAKCS